MTGSAHNTDDGDHKVTLAIGELIHAAERRGLTIGRAVRIGAVRGVIIGYNIAHGGRFPALSYPLLVKTELGNAKFGLDEVVPE